ncbi:hypothetical protein [Flavobacterium sp. HTF]|uniref:hypothetical protein n=1 Tax=Flavobacterium sp. HTF TaxID=2170732 RepID=UPI000D5CAE2B|nr:hypothetical protein [Flavobacterium sp. HTF]PWB24654.1 hypothetical protein DCO46_11090 [Flavobacterium sp. HTF]
MLKAVLIDTCFLIKLLDNTSDLHQNALGYFQYFLKEKIVMKISTISIAEYCVRGDFEDIPIRNLQIINFNLPHAHLAGGFAEIVFRHKRNGAISTDLRSIIPNDTKLFAQASIEESINCFVTCDSKAEAIYKTISSEHKMNFDFWDINITVNDRIGILPF